MTEEFNSYADRLLLSMRHMNLEDLQALTAFTSMNSCFKGEWVLQTIGRQGDI